MKVRIIAIPEADNTEQGRYINKWLAGKEGVLVTTCNGESHIQLEKEKVYIPSQFVENL